MRNDYIVGDSISYLCITVNSKDIYMGLFKDKHVAGAVCSQKIMEVCRDWLSQAPEYTI